jgi:pimeloyl-ACP methyl ester carboxylesterase
LGLRPLIAPSTQPAPAGEQACAITRPDGVRIAYRRTAARKPAGKAPVLLLHGLASNMTRWSEFVERTTLADDRDVIRVDLRGHGDSPTRGRISLQLWCDDLLALLDAEARRGRC